MNQLFNRPIEEIIRERKSVRTYTEEPLTTDERKLLEDYFPCLSNPFSAKVRFKFIMPEDIPKGLKLGTYGMIAGEKIYIGSAVEKSEHDIEGLGYEFEKLVLYAASLGLGTCWLGGTFTKDSFAKMMEPASSEVFPAVTPVGRPEG